MRRSFRYLFCFQCLILLTLISTINSEWADNCRPGGQCAELLHSFEALISGDGCRSFFYTGKCSRICTFSVRSLLGRQKWPRCADRCGWPQVIVHGAQNWLQMCISRPAPDVFENDHEEEHNQTSVDSLINLNQNTSRINSVFHRTKIIRLMWWILLFGCFGFLVTLANRPDLRARIKRSARRTASWIRLMKENGFQGRAKHGTSTLDIGPDRMELRNLQRGARRHLKAMRSTLD